MQKVSNSIKRPNLIIMVIAEGEGVQTKGTCNIFNKLISEIFQKSQENFAYSGIGSLQDTKET
jgi:hypothetical protein